MVFSAQAQRAVFPPGQPILFSSPDSDAVASNAPPLSAKPTEPLDFANALQIPSSFNFNRSSAAAPASPSDAPVILPSESQRLQDLLDKRRNWMLLTPAEILGVPTPEKILGIPERGAAGQRKSPTALEHYTERQSQTPPANTNVFRAGDLALGWNFTGLPRGQLEASNFLNDGLWNPAPLLNPPFNSGQNNQTPAGQNENSGWLKLFASPSPSPAPNAGPPIDTDRFRQLFGSGLSSAAAATPSSNGMKSSLLKNFLDSGPGQPSLNPIGASFAPLNSGIGKPTELPTLPSAWGLGYTPLPPAAAWVPQPPPWMSPTPQPFAAPQRKF
jgi:hypothetical protein